MEDLGQLIFVVLFILFGLISGSKKKKKVPPKQPPQRPRIEGEEDLGEDVVRAPAVERGHPIRAEEAPAPFAATGQSDMSGEPKRSLAEELLGLLQQEPAQAEAPVHSVPPIDDEAQSIDAYETPRIPTHERAREKVVDEEPDEDPYEIDRSSRPRPYAVRDKPHERPYRVEKTKAPEPYTICSRSDRKKNLSRSELRHAFVMKEILGPPKALED